MIPRSRLVPAILFVVVGVALAVLAVARLGPPERLEQHEVKRLEDVLEPRAARPRPADTAKTVRIARTRIAEGADRAGIDRLPAGEPYEASAGRTLRAYLSPKPGPFFQLLRGWDVEPPAPWVADRETAEEYWSLSAALLINADLRPEEAIVLRRVVNGRRANADPPGLSGHVRRSSRDDARAFLSNLEPADTNVVEAIIPGTFTAQDGHEFDGHVGFVHTYEPKGERWVLTGTRLYGVPNGVTVIPPPL